MSVLKNKTLVLNKVWVPVHISTVRDAIVLMYRGIARAVHHETYQTYNFDDWLEMPPNGNGSIHSCKLEIAAPHVVVLSTYDKVPMISTFSKRNVFKRDKHTCQYCGGQGGELTLDHVLPRSKGGETVWTNIVTACEPCNKKKADMTPEEANMKLARKPFKPDLNLSSIVKKMAQPNPVWKKFIG